MGMAQIVTVEPVVNADAEEVEVEHPADKVRTVLGAELLTPAPVFEDALRHVFLLNCFSQTGTTAQGRNTRHKDCILLCDAPKPNVKAWEINEVRVPPTTS